MIPEMIPELSPIKIYNPNEPLYPIHHHHEIPSYSFSWLNRLFPNQKRHRSTNLQEKLLRDVVVGTAVTFSVTPLLTIIDKAIVQRAAGTHSLISSGMESVQSIRKSPIQYIKSPTFLWMWGVYASTYGTANSLKTIMEDRKERNQNSNNTFDDLAVFLGTSCVNSAGSLMKDGAYARMFGHVSPQSIPKITYGLWMMRDFMVVGSSFILPDMTAQYITENYDMDITIATQLSQFFMPITMQFLAGPIQLLGLDFYNRPLAQLSYKQAFLERCRFLRNGCTSIVLARIARIAPAYSIGGLMNTAFRENWQTCLQDLEEEIIEIEEIDEEEVEGEVDDEEHLWSFDQPITSQ